MPVCTLLQSQSQPFIVLVHLHNNFSIVLMFVGESVLDDIRADWRLEDIWQRVRLVAGGAIGTDDGDGRSARHFRRCGVCRCGCLLGLVATVAKFRGAPNFDARFAVGAKTDTFA